MVGERQQRCVLFLGVNDCMLAQLKGRLDGKLPIKRLLSIQPLLDYIEAQPDKVQVVLLGLDVVDPVRVAQCVYAISRRIAIFILTEPSCYEQLRKTLKFSPFLGNDTTLWSVGELAKLGGCD